MAVDILQAYKYAEYYAYNARPARPRARGSTRGIGFQVQDRYRRLRAARGRPARPDRRAQVTLREGPRRTGHRKGQGTPPRGLSDRRRFLGLDQRTPIAGIF